LEPILYLVHRIPYPPNKGDKVRSYHLLRYLSERYRVFLGAFVDDSADIAHADVVRALSADAFIGRIDPRAARLKSLKGLATREPFTVPYYFDSALAAWVDATIRREGIRQAMVFSSAMAQYVLDRQDLRLVVDFVDVDSDKWTQYAQTRPRPVSWIYAREGRRLLEFERRVAARADAAVFVSPAEAALFARLAPETADKVYGISHGLDHEYFAPSPVRQSPYAPAEEAIVFTGVMDYWPNVDAVCWFARDVLPAVRHERPNARLYVVGMNPASAVRALATEAVVVTGRVPDVRPYLQHARLAVAPMRLARGIQTKVLEAMAMARPVITTGGCAAALTAKVGVELEVAQGAGDFVAKTLALLESPEAGRSLGQAGRRRVLADYDWTRNIERIGALVETNAVVRPGPAELGVVSAVVGIAEAAGR